MSSEKLSILIPTIPERSHLFGDLYAKLRTQIEKLPVPLGGVEIYYLETPKFIYGGLSVGKKREALINMAKGEYLCFVDDDETIAPNYIEQLVRLCNIGADIVTFKSIFKCDYYWGIANMSLHHPINEQATPYGEFKRKPFHICPVKTTIAQRCKLPDINNAEDWAYMEQVLPQCTTEVHTEQILHQYNHSVNLSEVDRIA